MDAVAAAGDASPREEEAVNYVLTRMQAAFLSASYEGRLEEIQELARMGVGMEIKDPMDAAGPLHLAAAGGHFEIVQYFVEQLNADINQLTNDGATPLCLAVSDGMLEITRYFVQLGADPQHTLSDGATPLILACIQGHMDLVRFLVEECHVNVCTGTKIGETPLFLAGQEGHYDIVRYLLEEGGADVNQVRNDGIAPLNNAAWAGHTRIVELLLNHGALVDARDFNGQTALHVASEKGYSHIAEVLLNGHADVDAADNAGSTPLCMAAAKGRAALVHILLRHGAHPGKSGWNGNSPVHLASWEGHKEVLKAMASDPHPGRSSETPPPSDSESSPAREGRKRLVDVATMTTLLNSQNYFGYTPLHLAVLQGNFEFAKYLLEEHSPDIHLQTCQGDTILHTALKKVDEGLWPSEDQGTVSKDAFLGFLYLLFSSAHAARFKKVPEVLATPNSDGVTPYDLIYSRHHDLLSLVEARLAEKPDFPANGCGGAGVEALPPGAVFVDQASQIIPGLSLENLVLISKETVLKAGHIPSFSECEAKNWHWKASDTNAVDKILFVSHSWSSSTDVDSCNRKYLLLDGFLKSQKGFDVGWVYIDYSCATQDKSSDLFQIHRLNVLTALWRATDFLILPKFIDIPCLFKANQYLEATNLKDYVFQPWCLLETLSAMLTRSRVYCSFQIGKSTAFRPFDRPEGGSSSLGFHQAYLDVWDLFMTQSREDMLEADRISLRAVWKVVEPCRLLGLLIALAKTAAQGEATSLLQSVMTLSIGINDVEQDGSLSEIWQKLGSASVEEEKLIALNLLLFMVFYSMNILSLNQESEVYEEC